MRRSPTLALRVLAVLLLVAAVAGAQAPVHELPGAWQPPAAVSGPLTLEEALRLTLAHDPNLRLEEAGLAFQGGLLLEQTGAFDISFEADGSIDLTQQEITASTKSDLQDVRDEKQEELDTLETQIASEQTDLDNVLTLQADPTGAQVDDPELQAQVDLVNLFIERFDGTNTADELTTLRDDNLETERVRLSGLLEELNVDADETREDLRKLGDTPEAEKDYNSLLSAELAIPLRNGITLTPFWNVGLTGTNYVGKDKATEFGGKGIADAYTSKLGFRFEMPFGSGRGRTSAAAGERAARIDYAASLAQLRHVVASRMLFTTQAYWALAGAQERLAIFEQSAALQERLLEITEALVRAGEVPRSDIARARARQVEAAAQVESARRDLVTARLTLVAATGWEVRDPAVADDAPPVAVDPFPRLPAELPEASPADYLRIAVDRRQDLASSNQLRESGKVLMEAARVDLAPQIDFSAEGSLTSIEENSSVDRGLDHLLLSAKWVGPSVDLGVTVDLPFANREARGKLIQSEATHRLRQIAARDLERTIRSDVLLAHLSLDHTAAELAQSEEAVERFREVVEAELEKLRLGSSTLIDAIFTEQQLTGAQLSLLAARQRYWQLVAQLRFATGTLVEGEGEAARVEDVRSWPEVGP